MYTKFHLRLPLNEATQVLSPSVVIEIPLYSDVPVQVTCWDTSWPAWAVGWDKFVEVAVEPSVLPGWQSAQIV